MEGCFVNSYPVLLVGDFSFQRNLKRYIRRYPLNLLALRSFVKDSTSGQALACTFRAVARYATLNRACPCVWRNVGMVVCLLHSIIFIMGLCGYQGRIATKSRGNLHLDNPITTWFFCTMSRKQPPQTHKGNYDLQKQQVNFGMGKPLQPLETNLFKIGHIFNFL